MTVKLFRTLTLLYSFENSADPLQTALKYFATTLKYLNMFINNYCQKRQTFAGQIRLNWQYLSLDTGKVLAASVCMKRPAVTNRERQSKQT